MTAPKHTPGPWTAKQNHWSRWEIHYGAGQLAGVAKPDDPASPPDTYAEAKANAHLIAAAPGLYAKLKWLADWMRSVEGMSRNNLEELALDEADEIDALLAKARGEG